MFSNFLIALLLGAGIGTWVYAKFQRSTGGNTKNSAIAAGITAVIVVIIVVIVLQFVFKHVK
jgi:uncharacterized membrane protein YeaQ/YmgE (transglycosylase-associated protein family)